VSGRNDSEVWFERYAAEHGLEGGDEHQPDLGGGTDAAQPDFRVRKGDSSAIVEVKEFETSVLDQRLKEAGPRNVVMLDAESELSTTRNKLEKAVKKQLRPYRHLGEPLIVCLANPNGIWVDLDSDDVLAAMNGDPAYVFSVNSETGEAVNDAHFQLTDNGSFVDSHRYVSAVMTLHRGSLAAEAVQRWHDENESRWAGIEDPDNRIKARVAALDDDALKQVEALEGDFYFVRVYESRWAALGEAVPVPRDLFNGPRDEFWAIDPETGTIAPIDRIRGHKDAK
jgi:hypothetical protein